MLGLMYLGAAVLYLALMFFVVRAAWRARHGSKRSIGAAFALTGFLCLPLFWGLLPTVLVHQEFCATDSGYQELVTPRQWAAKHPTLIEHLKDANLVASTKASATVDGFARDVDFAGARAWDHRITKARKWGVEVTRVEQRIVDAADGAVLAKSIDYSTGSQDHAAIWLTRPSCFSQAESPVLKLINYSFEMKGAVK